PVSRLLPDTFGRVTFSTGQPVNVRDVPSGEKIGTQPEGTRFLISGGPLCSGGYAWWAVTFDDGMWGYVAEGEPGNYYLEPWQ
ncbi:MAG: hypothetical protein JW910_19900, partial [Anaerolineae bacterium]|nr:hypothetical protein [Anaerolineae bacterium]